MGRPWVCIRVVAHGGGGMGLGNQGKRLRASCVIGSTIASDATGEVAKESSPSTCLCGRNQVSTSGCHLRVEVALGAC